MSSSVDQIKERLSIVDVIGGYIKVEKAGANYKARCPFHSEKTASFFISPTRQSYYCFGCNAKGDMFTFVEEFEGLDFLGTLKLLAARAGVELRPGEHQNRDEKEKLYDLMEAAAVYFSDIFAKTPEAKAYIESRGITDETVRAFRIGYAKDEWRGLLEYLLARGFKTELIERVGLIKKIDPSTRAGEPQKTGESFYDRFRGRIMFPIRDSGGRVIAFSGRLLAEKEKAPKYLNSPETVLFDKSSVLYGLDRAKDAIRKLTFSILVEGQIDLVLSHQAGFRNTVAVSGTAFDGALHTEGGVTHLGLLKRLSNNVVIALDADRAGLAASLRTAKIALSLGMDVKIADLPLGKDPADIIKENPETWKKIIRESSRVIDFVLSRIRREGHRDRALAAKVRDEVLPLVAALPSAIEQDQALSTIARETQIAHGALEEDFNKLKTKTGVAEAVSSAEPVTRGRKDAILGRLFGMIYWQENAETPLFSPTELGKQVMNIIGENEYTKWGVEHTDTRSDLVFQAEAWYADSGTIVGDLEELLGNLEEEYLTEALLESMRALHEAEHKSNAEESARLLARCQDISKRIHEIKARRFLEK